jgi:V/A-type H+-transporting ATPase subunit D
MKFAQEGYELLDQKRQILVVELMDLMDKTIDAQERVEKELADAFKTLDRAIVSIGRSDVYYLANAVNLETEIGITMKRIMGVNIPAVDIQQKDHAPYFSPTDTSFWIDEAILRFKNLLKEIGVLAERRISLMRIAEEVQKTVRRVNALEKIAIPDYQDSIHYIEEVLEETEREKFALLKLTKKRLEKGKDGSHAKDRSD